MRNELIKVNEMKGEKTEENNSKDVVEEVKADICDFYCKYPTQDWAEYEMEDTVCIKCPLRRL